MLPVVLYRARDDRCQRIPAVAKRSRAQSLRLVVRYLRIYGAPRALRTDIEQRAPFPVVGGGWITRARKIPIIAGRSASIGLPRAQEDRGS